MKGRGREGREKKEREMKEINSCSFRRKSKGKEIR